MANPESGGGTDREAIARLLRREGAEVEGFDPQALEAALDARPDRLVVASGDGTVGAAAGAAAARGVPLAVVPSGTANDFARALGVPFDDEQACRLAVRGERLERFDVGRMDGRPFVNTASVGLAERAGRRAKPFKRVLGPLAYMVGALRAGLTSAPVACRVRADGRELFEGRAWQVIVANTGRFGGGAEVAAADPRDGLLDVAVIPAGPRAGLVRHAYGMRSGRLASLRDVRHARAASIELEVHGSTGFNVDGELIRHGPARFSVEPRALTAVTG